MKNYDESWLIPLLKPLQLLAYGLGVLFFDWLDLPRDATLFLVSLMAIDTFTGVLKIMRWDSKKFTTHNLGIGVLTKFLTFLVMIAGSLLSKLVLATAGIDIGIAHMITVSIGLFGIAEFISICQNVYVFRTGEKVTEYDAMSLIIKWLQGTIRNALESFLAKK